ncbi:MAG: vWA domain-containing protein [Acidobacteriota bacterium]
MPNIPDSLSLVLPRSRSPLAFARRLLVFFVVVSALAAVGVTRAEEPSSDPGALVLVLDASGSMWGQVEGENKIVIARRALGQLVDGLPEDGGSDVALLAYGHRRKGDCDDIETIVPLSPLDRSGLKAAVDQLNPKGKTPITASVQQAMDLVEKSGQAATVILLSDGLETCGGDPCRAVRLAREAGLPMVLHVVGFDIGEEDQSQLQCMAAAGGGLYAPAEDAAGLSKALEQAVALPVTAPAGRLAVRAVADGQLHDVSVRVIDAEGETLATARTYEDAATNPTSIPLPDGDYTVRVWALGIKGEHLQRFPITIRDGGVVEKEVDFSTGEIKVDIAHNETAADVSYRIYSTGEDRANVATGRSRDGQDGKRLTAGTYDVTVKAVGIAGKPTHTFPGVELPPGGEVTLEHRFTSGQLKAHAVLGAGLVDATLSIRSLALESTVGQGRTYTKEKTNPKTFVVEPGRYRVSAKGLSVDGKPTLQREVDVAAGEVTEVTLDFGGD